MLTLLIESYNNIDGLRGLMEQISSQLAGRTDLRVLIMDDASDMVSEEITAIIPEGIKEITGIKRNPCHIGYPGVLANMFVDTTSKWCMVLTDSSVLCDGVFDVIFSDIEQFGHGPFGLIQYNTFDIRSDVLEDYLFIDSLDSFCENMDGITAYGGASDDDLQAMLTGLSNKVFNIEILSPFSKYAYRNARTYIPGYVAVLKALERRSMLLLHHNVQVTAPQLLTEKVDIKEAVTGMAGFKDIGLKASSEIRNKLIGCFSFNYMLVISDYISGGLTDKDYLDKIYNSTYKYCLDEKGDDFMKKLVELSVTGEDIMYLMDLLG